MKGLIFLLAVAMALAGCGAEKSASHAAPAGSVSPSPSPTPVRPAAHVGDTITDTDGDEFTVYQVTPFVSTNQFEQPKSGFRFIAVDAKEKAGPNGLNANPFDFAVVMDDDTRYQPTLGYKDPSLNATKLGGGQAVRGWVTFEVLVTNKVARVVLTDSTDIFWEVP
jgi:hypothetical protein